MMGREDSYGNPLERFDRNRFQIKPFRGVDDGSSVSTADISLPPPPPVKRKPAPVRKDSENSDRKLITRGGRSTVIRKPKKKKAGGDTRLIVRDAKRRPRAVAIAKRQENTGSIRRIERRLHINLGKQGRAREVYESRDRFRRRPPKEPPCKGKHGGKVKRKEMQGDQRNKNSRTDHEHRLREGFPGKSKARIRSQPPVPKKKPPPLTQSEKQATESSQEPRRAPHDHRRAKHYPDEWEEYERHRQERRPGQRLPPPNESGRIAPITRFVEDRNQFFGTCGCYGIGTLIAITLLKLVLIGWSLDEVCTSRF